MKRVFLFLTLLCSMAWTNVQAGYELKTMLMEGRQLDVEDLKDGTKVLLGVVQSVYNNFPTGEAYVTGQKGSYTNSWNCSTNTLGFDAGLSEDNVFEIVEAEDIVDPATEDVYPAFYLMHVQSGKYISCPQGGYVVLDVKEKAQALYAESNISGVGYTSESGARFNEMSMRMMNFVDGQTAYFGLVYDYKGTGWSIGNTHSTLLVNVYEAKYDGSAVANLKSVLVEYGGKTFRVGEDPGCYPEELVTPYEEACVLAQDALDLGADDDTCLECINAVIAAYEALQDARIPLTDGYYYVYNANPQFEEVLGQRTGWHALEDNWLYWEVMDTDDPAYVFKFTKNEDDKTWTIQSYAHGTYVRNDLSTDASRATEYIVLGDEPVAQEYGYAQSNGGWAFRYVGSPRWYYTDAFAYGAHYKSHVGKNSNGYDIGTYTWFLERVSDEKVAEMATSVDQVRRTGRVSNLIDRAISLVGEAYKYEPVGENLIEVYSDDAEESWVNHDFQLSGGSMANLNDGDPSTHLYLSPTSATPCTNTYLDIDLHDNAKQTIIIKYSKSTVYPNHAPYQMSVYARNSEEDDWTKVRMYTEMSSNNNVIDVTLSGIDMGQPYRYLRIVMDDLVSHSMPWGFPYLILGELSIYEGQYNAEYSQYAYAPGVKDAVDALNAILNECRAAVTANNATDEQYEKLVAAMATLKPLLANSDELDGEIIGDQAYVEKFGYGDDLGQVSKEAYDAMIAALTEAGNYDTEKPIQSDLNARLETLKTAFAAFKAAQKTLELNKWYYIVCQDAPLTGEEEEGATSAYGRIMYAQNGTTNDVANYDKTYIYHGLCDETGDNHELYNGAAMWYVENCGDTAVAIKNRLTGTYFANTNRANALSATPQPFELQLLAPGQVGIVSLDSLNMATDQYGANAYGTSLVGAYPPVANSRTAWAFEEVDAEVDALEYNVENNTITILTLPFESEGLVSLNSATVSFYAVHSMTETTIGLEKLSDDAEIAAGQPVVIIAGDPAAYDPEAEKEYLPLILSAPAADAYTTTAQTVNGLVGTLYGVSLNKEGFGYVKDGQAALTTESQAVIFGLSGYFDPKQVTNKSGEADYVIEFAEGGLTGITATTIATKAGNINVYSLDGKLVKKNSTSTKGLEKGIYVVGKKKVAVK